MRSAGKKLIGAQASAAIWQGVDEWLRQNPKKSVTDFVIEACMEKLDAEKIPFDHEAAIFDGRRRVPMSYTPAGFADPNSKVASGAAKLLKKGAASVLKHGPK